MSRDSPAQSRTECLRCQSRYERSKNDINSRPARYVRKKVLAKRTSRVYNVQIGKVGVSRIARRGTLPECLRCQPRYGRSKNDINIRPARYVRKKFRKAYLAGLFNSLFNYFMLIPFGSAFSQRKNQSADTPFEHHSGHHTNYTETKDDSQKIPQHHANNPHTEHCSD